MRENAPEIPTRTFSLREVAARLSVAEGTPRTWVRNGQLAAFRVGGRFRVTEEALQDFLSRSQRGVRS